MARVEEFKSNDEVAWCPGCGNFGILKSLKEALSNMGLAPHEVLICSGIGQAAKLPHYINANCFNGLHGRSLPVAVAAKMVNPRLKVIVTTGDGDCYGEGGNHLLHNIRRNVDITVLVHDNQIYGLTKGQASPTTEPGFRTKVQTQGVILEPLQPLKMAIALGAGFVARGFSGESGHLSGLIEEAVNYPGFSLVDILQPCVSFNKKNTYQWYRERVYKLDNKKYDCRDERSALEKAVEWGEKIPLGVIFRKERSSYEQKSGISGRGPAMMEPVEGIDIRNILGDFT